MFSHHKTLSRLSYSSLFASASVSVMALLVSQTASPISSQNIAYTVDNQNYEGYYAKADSRNAPFILLIHDSHTR